MMIVAYRPSKLSERYWMFRYPRACLIFWGMGIYLTGTFSGVVNPLVAMLLILTMSYTRSNRRK